MNTKALNPRTARTPAPAEDTQWYVLAHGAPEHYIDGYGLCRGGSIVTLAPGVTPGKWYVEISPEDAAKGNASETDAQRLAVLAEAKMKARDASGKNDDVARKEDADAKVLEARAEAEAAKAQHEADAIKRVADADAKAKEAQDATAAEKQRADEAEKRAADAEAELAKLQAEKAAGSKPADKPKG